MDTSVQDIILKNSDSFFKDCLAFARRYLILPKEIHIDYEDCPSKRFQTISNASEVGMSNKGQTIIYINILWLTTYFEKYKDDIRFIFFHELRHVYQYLQISLYYMDRPTNEKPEIIERWKLDFEHYKRNEGDHDSMVNNVNQVIEIDADAYGVALVNVYNLINNIQGVRISLPIEVQKSVYFCSKKYLNEKPEFANYRRFFNK